MLDDMMGNIYGVKKKKQRTELAVKVGLHGPGLRHSTYDDNKIQLYLIYIRLIIT